MHINQSPAITKSNSMLYDSHAHLEMLLEKIGLIENVRNYGLNEAIPDLSDEAKAKIDELLSDHEFLVHATVSTANFNLVYNFFKHNPKILYQLGSHPEIVDEEFNLDTYLTNQILFLKDAALERIIGIGEIGLDYYYTQDPVIIDKQKNLFRSQISLALQLNLPIVLHIRDAFEDAFKILDEFKSIYHKFEVHCFTGGPEELKGVLQRGGKIGLGGVLTYKNSVDLRAAVVDCPLESILIETDLPFLAPGRYRGKTCLPNMITETIEQIALIKGLSSAEILTQSKNNWQQLFKVEF